jgi:hypothetical protein
MALKDFFSFLRPKENVRYSSTINRFEIKDNKLTITDNGARQSFDLTAGMNDALASQLAQMGLSPSDLQNLIHLSQEAPFHSSKLLAINDEHRMQAFAGSPEKLADELSASVPVSQQEIKRLLHSGMSTHTSRVTIQINGQQHTYDTSSGISAELCQQLAQEMGISTSELETLLKLQTHSLQPNSSDCQPADGELRSDQNPKGKID